MTEGAGTAEDRLRERMARARAKWAPRHRFRSYVAPIGLVAAGLIVSVEAAAGPGYLISLAPMLGAAVLARTLCGITAGRVAVALTVPLTLYIGMGSGVWGTGWLIGYIGALIALCVEPSTLPRLWKWLNRRSAVSGAPGRSARRMQTR